MVNQAIQESKKNGCKWLYKLLAAAVSGAAAAAIPSLTSDKPDLHAVWFAALIGGLVGGFLYLKQSPLPPINGNGTPTEEKK
jgi:hypothetical protein